jgi:branched-subunit amino acid transport protein
MTRAWAVVLLVGTVTAALKAAGPALLGGTRRDLPPPVLTAFRRLPAAIFAALVVTQVFARGSALAFDARVGGLAAAIVSVACRAPRIVTLIAAVLVTALLRRAPV